jgi:hypothetical protein
LLAAPVRVAARATVPRSAASPRRAVAREYRVPAVYPDDVRISVHEAAHAVVAVKCGWGIRSVRIGLNPPAFTSRGRTSMSNSDRPNATTFGLVVASLAGSEAERHAFGNVGPGNDAGDIEAAREDLADLFTLRLDDPAIESRWLPFAREQAAECVARHWDAISRVAAALRRHRTLDGQQVAVLIDTDAERTT